MDAVLADVTIHQRRQTLRKMTTGFGLDDAYRTTLDRIRDQKGNGAKLGMEALMWIFFIRTAARGRRTVSGIRGGTGN